MRSFVVEGDSQLTHEKLPRGAVELLHPSNSSYMGSAFWNTVGNSIVGVSGRSEQECSDRLVMSATGGGCVYAFAVQGERVPDSEKRMVLFFFCCVTVPGYFYSREVRL